MSMPTYHSSAVGPSGKSAGFARPAPGGKLARAVRPAVLHMCPALDPDETARETVELAILTQRSGQRAVIVSGGGSLVTSAERAAVRHARMPIGKPGWFMAWRNRVHLEALYQRERPVVVHAHGIEVLPHALRYSQAHRVPLLLDLTQPIPAQAATLRLLARLDQQTHIIRVPSQFMQNYLTTTLGVKIERIRIVPPGVDLVWHNAAGISSERLHKLSHLWRLPELAAVILVPMPLVAGFGHKILLQAMAELRAENVYTILVGQDDAAPGMRTAIEQQIQQAGLTGKVIMPDYCTDWPAAYWLSSIVVAPNSVPRGQNIELLAAQAMGRPIIATDSGANAEMVRSGETAWLIERDNARLLVEVLREALRLDTEQRLNIAANTRAFIEETFPQSAWFDGMMELYDALLNAKSLPRLKAA